MTDGKEGTRPDVVAIPATLRLMDSMTDLQAWFKRLDNDFKTWMIKQSIPVEAAIVTAFSAAQGAAIGAFMSILTSDLSSALPTTTPSSQLDFGNQLLAPLKQAQAIAGGPLVQARNFAVMSGVNAGLSCVMRRMRGKEDIQSSMLAAFGSGTMFSLVSGMGRPNQLSNVFASGLLFAVVQGGLFKLGQKFSQQTNDDIYYTATRSMLASLGLQSYERNFRRGLLTDKTLPLLTDSALRDVKIPPGPRLLILDHIKRDAQLRMA